MHICSTAAIYHVHPCLRDSEAADKAVPCGTVLPSCSWTARQFQTAANIVTTCTVFPGPLAYLQGHRIRDGQLNVISGGMRFCYGPQPAGLSHVVSPVRPL